MKRLDFVLFFSPEVMFIDFGERKKHRCERNISSSLSYAPQPKPEPATYVSLMLS